MGGNWPEAVGDPKDKQSFNARGKLRRSEAEGTNRRSLLASA